MSRKHYSVQFYERYSVATYFNVVTRLCPQLERIRNKMLINPALFRTLQFTPKVARVDMVISQRRWLDDIRHPRADRTRIGEATRFPSFWKCIKESERVIFGSYVNLVSPLKWRVLWNFGKYCIRGNYVCLWKLKNRFRPVWALKVGKRCARWNE